MVFCANGLSCIGLGFLPGLLHAWYIISVTPEPTYISLSEDPERGQGHVTYYYVNAQNSQPASRPKPSNTPGGPSYGTVNKSAPNSQFPVQSEGFVQPPTAASQALPGGSRVEGAGGEEVPPSYQQAVGDHKVQGP